MLQLRNPYYIMPYRLVNGIMFNLTWLGIVVTQSAVIAPVLAGAYLVVHFFLMGEGKEELRFIAGFAIFGVCVDQVLFRTGVFTVAGIAAGAPVWMGCLWPALATTFRHAFAGLRTHLLLSALVGGVGGAASYIAGTRLTDVAFTSDAWGIVILALLWAVIFPVALVMANETDDGEASIPHA